MVKVMVKRVEPPQYSEPDTIISINAKNTSLRDVWEVSINNETLEHEGMIIRAGVEHDTAKQIAEIRGCPVIEFDSAFDI